MLLSIYSIFNWFKNITSVKLGRVGIFESYTTLRLHVGSTKHGSRVKNSSCRGTIQHAFFEADNGASTSRHLLNGYVTCPVPRVQIGNSSRQTGWRRSSVVNSLIILLRGRPRRSNMDDFIALSSTSRIAWRFYSPVPSRIDFLKDDQQNGHFGITYPCIWMNISFEVLQLYTFYVFLTNIDVKIT